MGSLYYGGYPFTLPTVFKLLGIAPFKKAEFTPDNSYTRKQPLSSETKSSKNLSSNGNKNEGEERVSDADVDKIVGVGDSSKLEEMDPPSSLQPSVRTSGCSKQLDIARRLNFDQREQVALELTSPNEESRYGDIFIYP